jgi:DNA-binding beta-propeller fold protein YncE
MSVKSNCPDLFGGRRGMVEIRITGSAWLIMLVLLDVATWAQDDTYPTTQSPVTLLSANDGTVMRFIDPDLSITFEDSITVVQLGPDHPPVVKTVFGTVPNSISGPPHMAIAGKGQFGFVTSHSIGLQGIRLADVESLPPKDIGAMEPNGVSVIDLASPDLAVVKRIPLPPYPLMAAAHPDGNRVLVVGGWQIHILTIVGGEQVVEVKSIKVPVYVSGIAISPCGTRIFATGLTKPDEDLVNPFVDWSTSPHVFHLKGEHIEYQGPVASGRFDDPFHGTFSPRFTPDGKRALVLNGLGLALRGGLDELLIIDMTLEKPAVTDVVPQLGDGLESLAIHPSGTWAVVSCLEGTRNAFSSHLAVIDLQSEPPRLLYHVPIDPVPEGIEFTPDGQQIFVGCTAAHHIAIFDVVAPMQLKRRDQVIRTGNCPSSLAIWPKRLNQTDQ